jgi:type II secretory pathway pseudopilin PulG
MENTRDSKFMGLRGQNAERGYAMAALLIALAIMAILLTVAMPVWRHEARREREAELVFRGEQYARAVALFRFKNANIPNAFPPSIDALVQGRFLRKKYLDPMTKDGEFELIGVGSQQPGINPSNPAPPTARGSTAPPPAARGNTFPQPGGTVAGGMMGVRSKSTDTSIRSYRGATRYDQWAFTFNIAPRPGGAMPMANTADGAGGGGRDGRGGFGGRDGRGGFGGRDGRGGPRGGDGRAGPGGRSGSPTGPPRGGGPGGRGAL